MLQRLLSGGEESDFVLLVSKPSVTSTDILNIFLKSCQGDSILVKTGPSQDLESQYTKVVDLTDILGWKSGITLKFPECILKDVDPGKHVIVINCITDLLMLHNPSAVACLLRKLKQKASNKTKMFGILHEECLDENLMKAIEQLATTSIFLDKLEDNEIYPKLCKISHRKLGGKLVTSKEVIRFDTSGNIRIERFEEKKVKAKFSDGEDADEALEKLTTFNITAGKNKEKEAKDKLVLPFYTDEQKQNVSSAGEVKIKGEIAGKIYYEPDSGDDWDDDDPDDDLDF